MQRSLVSMAVMLAMVGPAMAQTSPPAPATERHVGATRADEDLAIAALEGLMSQPAERALPILKKVLAGSHPTRIKRRALFVLSQIDSAEARQILAQTSRSTDTALRGEAIRSIGISGHAEALDALQDIYKNGDQELKDEVLEAWLIAGRKDAVYQAALTARTEQEANRAIRTLGAMGATEELRKLGDQPKAASGLVDAYAISGDLASLRKIAEGNGATAVRVEAVRKIGIVDGEAARAALRDIYTKSTDADIKEAARDGLLISGDEQSVLMLYRAAKTTEEKRELLRTLSHMNGDAALQAIDAALEERK